MATHTQPVQTARSEVTATNRVCIIQVGKRYFKMNTFLTPNLLAYSSSGHTSLSIGGPSSSGGGGPPPPHHLGQQQHGGPQTLNLVSVNRPGSNPPPSHSGSITPTNLPSPGNQGGGVVVGHSSQNPGSGSDYENGPLMKRSRITEGWAT